MSWCLIKSEEQSFRKALVDKKLDPFKLSEMTSEERRAEFEKYVTPENAKNINALYESKLLLKNQITGFKNWAKRAVGMKPVLKRDLISKIERLNDIGVLNPTELKNFKEDMVRTRLGLNITIEEAQKINDLSEKRTETKKSWDTDIKNNPQWNEDPHKTRKEWINNKNRIEYGISQVNIENYVNDLKLESKKISFIKQPIRATINAIGSIPSVFKSLMASLDNSFWGRQGIKNLLGSAEQKKIWGRNFIKSFGDIGAELANKKINGLEPMDLIKADIYSRPNQINGKYKAGDYKLGVLSEEAFPTSLPERVPFLGRLFKASETAYNGGALRMRADLADLLISKAEKFGINTLNPDQARGLGHLVGSLTGRGTLGKAEAVANELNVLLFSARFFKSNVDTLIAPISYASEKLGLIKSKNEGESFARKTAATNTMSVIAHIAGIMMIAKFLNPDSVDEDPRSTNFGKIKIFGHWIDITGGMRSVIIPVSKILPTKRDGVWGSWSKSSTGNWTNLSAGQYGQQDGVDVLMDALILNKLSPAASIARDAMKGEMFGGDPFDIKKSIINSVTPLSIQSVNDVKDEGYGAILTIMISEFLGLGTSTYKYSSNWSSKTSKEMNDFKSQVGEDLFKSANVDYNRAYNLWESEVQQDPRYKELSDEGKASLKTDAKSALKDKILREYGYHKEKTIKTSKQLDEEYDIKDLAPRK
jgi:hypothetical protein